MKICVGCAPSGVVELVYAPAVRKDWEEHMKIERKLASAGKISGPNDVYPINDGVAIVTNFSDVEEARAFLLEECDSSNGNFLSLVA